MSLGPLLSGRIPSTLVGERLTAQLQTALRGVANLEEQVGTGQKFFLPSEAPSAAVRTIVLQKLLERKTVSQTNVQTNQSLLSATETALSSVSDALNSAKGLIFAGIGASSSPAEREGLAIEAGSILRQVLIAANTQFRGRYLFGGSQGLAAPFTALASGFVRYDGDRGELAAVVDVGHLLENNVSGAAAFGGFSVPVSRDANPALTLETRLSDLLGGQGVTLGPIAVTLDDGVNAVTHEVDLAGSETIGDLQARLQEAFALDPITLAVDVDPGTQFGLRLVPSSGTVAVADVNGGLTAADLGIRSSAVATINGGDLDPRLTLLTPLASLNGGAGIAAVPGQGLSITLAGQTVTVDVSAATTIEDLYNLIRQTRLDLDLGINAAGNGLAISSRVSGASLSIGENGGSTATLLGIRTLDSDTLLEDLNLGIRGEFFDAQGRIVTGYPLRITRRSGTDITIDLAGARTVQDVLDIINAVDPGNLVAGFKGVGNGLTLTDNSGANPLSVDNTVVASFLGLAGTEPGTDPLVPLEGTDVAPQEVPGVFNILARLQTALSAGDDRELQRLSGLVDSELNRVSQARGEVGGRLRMLDELESRLGEETLHIQESLSLEFDADLAEVLTQLSQRQFTLEATLKIAAQTYQLSLVSFL